MSCLLQSSSCPGIQRGQSPKGSNFRSFCIPMGFCIQCFLQDDTTHTHIIYICIYIIYQYIYIYLYIYIYIYIYTHTHTYYHQSPYVLGWTHFSSHPNFLLEMFQRLVKRPPLRCEAFPRSPGDSGLVAPLPGTGGDLPETGRMASWRKNHLGGGEAGAFVNRTGGFPAP